MKIKLINKQTNEEHICSKIVIDGFDYYVNDDKIDDEELHYSSKHNELHSHKYRNNKNTCKKIIATNNPSIDLPKIVNEIRNLAQKTFGGKLNKKDDKIVYTLTKGYLEGFITGYNKSQESHPFSEDDLISFGKFIYDYDYRIYGTKTNEELLQIWKEKRIKTIYYV